MTLLRVGGVGAKRDRREIINIEVVTIYLPNGVVSMIIFTGLLVPTILLTILRTTTVKLYAVNG